MPTLVANTRKQNWYIDAEDAVSLGLADRVGVVLNPVEPRKPSDLLPQPGDDLDVRLAKATIRVERAKAAVTQLDNSSLSEDKTPTLQFFGGVSANNCDNAKAAIEQFAGREDTTLRFLINTPGGEVHSGLALLDVMDEVKASGTKIETIALGEAASMGGFLLQGGNRRLMGKHARLLIHRISTIFPESTNTEQEELAARMLKVQERAMPRLTGRSNMSVEDVLAKCDGRNWWMHADKAEEHGFVDKGGII
jgi:ATP-dependent Clp endopeptidase proteolytic subunit ClpP